MLTIQLFGTFSIKDEGAGELGTATPRMQSLLAYLLLLQGSLQPRQQIASRLWPETNEAQARTNLRNLLHRLKRIFPELEDYIEEDHGGLQWRPGAQVRFDVAEFQAAVTETKTSVGDPLAALERAARLYTGDLLPGCYDEWILSHREVLHQEHLDVLERLVVLLEERGAYRLAIHYAQRSLRNDPLNEVIYRHLIRLHGLSGDRTGGLRVYHTCAAVLEQELGAAPSAATREAYRLLLEDVGGLVPKPSAGPTPAPSARKGTLPYPLTNFIGREKEIEEVLRLLTSTRLLTLTGAPGAGKTRFGLEIAARLRQGLPEQRDLFSAGVWWVDLTASFDLATVTQAAAVTLGVRENAEESLFQTLIGWIGQQELLLALDNAEHVIDALSELAQEALHACPNLHLLITSREALSIPGEVAWTVPPMSYPIPDTELTPDALMRFESARLFVERAAAAMPTFRLTPRSTAFVAQICVRLEGIPLAIELAAARVKMMTVEQIAVRTVEALQLLRSGRGSGPNHHQTIEAAIEWSYRLLSDKERMLFQRLAVFSGGFSLEAAEYVGVCCETASAERSVDHAIQPGEILELLSRLIDRSLVNVLESEFSNESRYTLLEMLRQYAVERLREAGEMQDACERHAEFCVRLTEEADQNVRGPQQAVWLRRLETEHDNLRKALRWAVESGQEETSLRLVNSLWQFWDIRGYYREGRELLQQALSLSVARTSLRAKSLKGAGALAWSQGDYAEARERMFASLEIYRELGEQRDMAVGLFNLGLVTYSQRDYAAAEPILRESLAAFRALDHKQGIANALNSLGVVAAAQGDYHTARILYEESLSARRELGDQRGLAISYGNLGVTALRQGDLAQAQHYMDESLRRYQEIADKRGIATTLNEMGQLAQQQGQPELAYRHFRQALAIWQELGSKEGLAASFEGIAMVAGQAGRAETARLFDAAQLLGAADSLRDSAGALLLPSDEPLVRQAAALLRERLGPDAFARAWEKGRRIEPEQAGALALLVITE